MVKDRRKTQRSDDDNERRKQRSGEEFDIIIGLLGFWALALFIVAALLELTGRPDQALIPALILLAVVLALLGMLRLRKKLPPRTTKRPS